MSNSESRRVLLMKLLIFGVAYFGCAMLGKFLAVKPGAFVSFWLPSGLYLAALLINEKRTWAWYTAAAVFANLCFDLVNHQPLKVTMAFSCGNALEAWIGAWLIQRFTGARLTLCSRREVAGLIFWAGLSTMISATVGAFTITHWIASGSFWRMWILWWSGAVLGVLLMGSCVLAWQDKWRGALQGIRIGRMMEVVALLIAFIFATVYVFRQDWHPNFAFKYALIPGILWAALRLGQHGSSTFMLLMSIIIGLLAQWHHVLEAPGLSVHMQVVNLQFFLATLSATGLFGAALLAEREQSEDSLRKSEATLRGILEAVKESVVMLDLDGRIEALNTTTAQRLNRRPEELLHNNIRQFISDSVWRSRREQADRVLETKGGVEFEDFRNGRYFLHNMYPLFDSQGEVSRFVLVSRDVTSRKEAEIALRESEERYASLFKRSLDGVLLTAPDGRIFSANPAACAIFGGSEADLVEAGRAGVVDSADPQLAPALEARLRVGAFKGEFTLLRKDGSKYPGEISSICYQDRCGELRSCVVFRDITERKQAEERLQQNQQQLRSLAVALSQAEEQARHELATILHDTIMQSMALARMKLSEVLATSPAPNVQELVTSVRGLMDEAIQRSRSLTSQLSPPLLKELGLEPALDWLAEQFSREHGLPCRFSSEDPLPRLSSQQAEFLFRAARELLMNCLKHAKASKTEIRVKQEGEILHLTVADNGLGFDPAQIDAPLDKAGAFGLYSLRERVGFQGGRCSIVSKPGSGTKVVLAVPLQSRLGQ
jgi:PAS domain S-box-containing protein